MIYFCIGMLAIDIGLIILFSHYQKETIREKYSVRGMYAWIYSASYFLYEKIFKRFAKKEYETLHILYPGEKPEEKQEASYLKKISLSLMILLIVPFLVLLICITQNNQTVLTDQFYIKRNSQGEGSQEVDLTAVIGDEEEEVSIVVEEKQLDEDDAEELKILCEEYLEQAVLGENEDLSSVSQDLNLVSEISQYSVDVDWTISDYSVIRSDGTVENEELEENTSVVLTANCSYFEEEWETSFTVTVVPLQKDEDTLREEALYAALEEQEEATASEDYLVLPDQLDGEAIQWSEQADSTAGVLLLLGGVVIVLLFARDKENYAKDLEKRKEELTTDYPVFVHKVVLLLGAGMTPKAVWYRMISDYNKRRKKGGKKQYVYEEMIVTANEMSQGVAEVAAYENFGRRCQTSSYLKFSSILIASVKTGAKGMGRMLTDAGEEAMLIRRENARRLGEEAGTKLLFPMIILMGVVMCMIMVPAFMTMEF